ncbi:MAG TPA: rRNA maturation RNase YbeY [Sphingomicrobium sp.]|nr:rRNA maturation RNase YbeY [Sphingomicrobium sp.]
MLEIAVEAGEEWDSSRPWDTIVRKAAEAAIAESAFPQIALSRRPFELSVRLAGNEEMRALNAKWRGKDNPTNVLSFPLLDEEELLGTNVIGPELLLGDIILARGVCLNEAAEKGVSFEDHASHLLVHGMFHLLGYDHEGDDEARDMEAREIRALNRLGIANPYEEAA